MGSTPGMQKVSLQHQVGNAEAASLTDGAAARISTFPAHRQPLLDYPAPITKANAINSSVAYIYSFGSVPLENSEQQLERRPSNQENLLFSEGPKFSTQYPLWWLITVCYPSLGGTNTPFYPSQTPVPT